MNDNSPAVTDTANVEWIDTPEALHAWFAPVAGGDVIGLDTEFERRNTFYSKLALLQLGHAGRQALVDPLAFDIGTQLHEQLGQRDVVCVMHSAGEDLETLAPWLPEGPATLFDTQIAAAFAGLGHGIGYQGLVETLCGTHLDKGETRSDWMRRPLSPAQKRYATLDVVYLEPLYRRLSERLTLRDRLAWCRADCAQLKARAHVDEWAQQPQRALSAAAPWPQPVQARLRQLLLWREQAARQWDKPRTWLLDNAHALDVARNPPTDLDALSAATRGQRALRGAQRRQLLELLQAGPSAADIAATRPIPEHPDRAHRALVTTLKQEVARQAKGLDLPPPLLCSRKHLEALVADGTWPEALSGWREQLLRVPLLALLPA